MESFKYIIKNLLNNSNILCSNIESDIQIKILFELFLSKTTLKIQDKFDLLKNTLDNIFISEQTKLKFLSIYCKIQNIYFSFLRLNNQYKYKKYKIVIDTDLLLNPLLKDNKYCFHLIQNKNKYLFSSNDIINLFYNSLTNSTELFLMSSLIKNPYNNIKFDKSTMYNMYFFIKNKTISNIELIDKYFNCNFDLELYNKEYRYLLREYIIKNYIKNASNEQFKEHFDDMISDFNDKYCKKKVYKIDIHEDFPISELKIIMSDYVYLYLTSLYSLIEYKRDYAKSILTKKLIKFRNYNPLFGRKYIRVNNYFCSSTGKIKKRLEITFNNKHINFNDKSNKWSTNMNNVFFTEMTSNQYTRYLYNDNELYEDLLNINRELYFSVINESRNQRIRNNSNETIIQQITNEHDESSISSESVISTEEEYNNENNSNENNDQDYHEEYDYDNDDDEMRNVILSPINFQENIEHD